MIVGLAGLVLSESHVQKDAVIAVNTTTPKKLRTFHDALHDAMGIKEEKKPSAPSPARVYFEVIRVNERVIVDERNHTKGYTASMRNALYSLESGKLRRLYLSKMLVKPKPGSRLFKSISSKRFLEEQPPQKSFKKWIEELAYKLHLDKFWPRLIFSIACGFFCTAIIYLTAWLILSVFWSITGYESVAIGEECQKKSPSTENLLNKERIRLQQKPPTLYV